MRSDDLGTVLARLRQLARTAGRGNIDRFGSYHNHTTWSDGIYDPEDLVRRAIQVGLVELGISDHGCTQKGGIRCVHDSQIDAYRETLTELRNRYLGRIRILVGLEIDGSRFNPNRLNLPFDELGRLDYVLFEYVGEPAWGGLTLGQFLETRARIKCPVGLAHPDMPLLIAENGAAALAKTLADQKVFIDACGSARNSRAVLYGRPGVSRQFTLNIEGLGEEFKAAARSCGLKFLPSADTHRDDDRDALADTINAIATIVEYDLPRMAFKAQRTKGKGNRPDEGHRHG